VSTASGVRVRRNVQLSSQSRHAPGLHTPQSVCSQTTNETNDITSAPRRRPPAISRRTVLARSTPSKSRQGLGRLDPDFRRSKLFVLGFHQRDAHRDGADRQWWVSSSLLFCGLLHEHCGSALRVRSWWCASKACQPKVPVEAWKQYGRMHQWDPQTAKDRSLSRAIYLLAQPPKDARNLAVDGFALLTYGAQSLFLFVPSCLFPGGA
jgi:hypothetical protein